MTHKTYHTFAKIAMAAILLMTLVSCKDEKGKLRINFSATMEQMSNTNSKVHLVNEQYIYWERSDRINIASDASTGGDNQEIGDLVNAGSDDFSDYNGVFVAELPEGSKYFLGLHPYSNNNIINPTGGANFTASIELKSTQPYRNDYSFAKQVLPMVARYAGNWGSGANSTPFNLDFHSLAGIVRLQFYNSSGADHTITSITVSSADKQLCGLFAIQNINTTNPKLSPSANIEANRTLTLSMPSGGLEFKADSLRSFYVVLPSLSGSDAADEYTLTVTVNTDGGSFSHDLNVKIRRNAITYSRAYGITSFSPIATTGGIVGNGTATRPYKIYSVADLKIVRDSFAHPRTDGYVYINGQKVTSNSQFRIMTSTIELTTSNWQSGIQNFTGHMLYLSNAPVAQHGITNISSQPLFASIASGGIVEGLTVRSNHSVNSAESAFSLFCATNNGQIIDCHMTTPPTDDVNYYLRFYGTNFAGICCTNNGTIEGSSCSVLARIAGNFTGICHTNSGTIRGCIASSPMDVYNATNAAGICYQNNGTVEDCYFDARYSSGSTAWGGICWTNGAAGTVRHCYISAGAIIHGTTVGGIVATNNGTIDYCWNAGELRGTTVGGIVATQSGAASKLTNCFINDDIVVITLFASASAHYAGGLAAVVNGGSIKDCHALMSHIEHRDNTGIYGTLVGHVGTGAKIENCYSYATEDLDASPKLYGDTTAGARVFTRTYFVGGTQDGVTTVANETAPLATLRTNLDDNRTTTRHWIAGLTIESKVYPTIEAYTIPAKHSTKRR